jgi:hypothetical protein
LAGPSWRRTRSRPRGRVSECQLSIHPCPISPSLSVETVSHTHVVPFYAKIMLFVYVLLTVMLTAILLSRDYQARGAR